MRQFRKLIILIFIILIKQSIAFAEFYPQLPDSVNQTTPDTQGDDFSSFMFQDESFISSSSTNDSIVAKVTQEKKKKRIEAYYLAQLKLVKDSITIDSINIDSIAFIFVDTIYDFNFKVNFLESIAVCRTIDTTKIAKKSKEIIKPTKEKTKQKIIKDKVIAKHKVVKPTSQNQGKEFYVIVLIIIVLLFAWINLYYKKSISTYLQGMYNYSVTQRLFSQNSILLKRINIATFVLFILNTSLFITLFVNLFNLNYLGISSTIIFISLIASLIIFYSLKILLYKILGNVFKISRKVDEFYFGTFVYNKVFGIILMPINIILPFINPEIAVFVLEFTIIFAFILLTAKLLRGIFVAIGLKFPIVYLILYLCALEILPLLAFVKFLYT